MAFNVNEALAAKVIPRVAEVPTPELAGFFEDGESPVWRVRNLEANELIIAEEAKANLRKEGAIADALASGDRQAIVDSVRVALGRNPDDIQPNTAQRLELLRMGSVEPECTLEFANWMQVNHGVVFLLLTNKILMLSGQGSDVEKKPSDSGETPASS